MPRRRPRIPGFIADGRRNLLDADSLESPDDGSWQRKALPMMFRGINVVSISVPDFDQAHDFYEHVLGLGAPVYDLPDAGWIEFQTGGGGNLSIILAESGWTPSTGTTVVLNVRDCTAAAKDLRAREVRCEEPQTFPGFVTFASFFDPFGNRLQMCSPA